MNTFDLDPIQHGAGLVCDFHCISSSAAALKLSRGSQIAGTGIPFDFGKVGV